MSALDDAEVVHADDRGRWRAWLEANHASARGVWLVTRRRGGLSYDESVEEALCFGWIDGTNGRFDDERGKQYFAPRKAGSGWAATNKARIERMLAQGRMAPAGLATIERAKADGSWTLLDSVERLEVPDDLAAALAAQPPAAQHFAAFPASARKMMLAWLVTARRAETRASRVAAIAEAAAANKRARG